MQLAGRSIALMTVLILLVLMVGVLWVQNCTGPRPVVSGVDVLPPVTAGGPYRVSARVRNDGPGEGQTAVTFRLRDRRSGQTYEEQKNVTLASRDQVTVLAEFAVGEGDYEPGAEAQYPPR